MATLTSRRDYLNRLLVRLKPQLTDDVRVITFCDQGQLSIGRKRQMMLEQSTGDYVSFVDDDDLVSEDYCERVLSVLNAPNPPGVVGFRLTYIVDGKLNGSAVHSYDAENIPTEEWAKRLHRWNRLPNHLNPTRLTWALKSGYKDLQSGEDGDYARRLASFNPRPREVFIDAPLYEYRFRSLKPPGL